MKWESLVVFRLRATSKKGTLHSLSRARKSALGVPMPNAGGARLCRLILEVNRPLVHPKFVWRAHETTLKLPKMRDRYLYFHRKNISDNFQDPSRGIEYVVPLCVLLFRGVDGVVSGTALVPMDVQSSTRFYDNVRTCWWRTVSVHFLWSTRVQQPAWLDTHIARPTGHSCFTLSSRHRAVCPKQMYRRTPETPA